MIYVSPDERRRPRRPSRNELVALQPEALAEIARGRGPAVQVLSEKTVD